MTLHARVISILTVALLPLACGGTARAPQPCTPPAADRWSGGRVYAACEVERQAVITNPNERFELPPSPGMGCLAAELEFVVTAAGDPDPRSVQVLSATSRPFTDAMIRALPQFRYRPAMREGVAVPQLVRLRRAAQIVVTRVVVPAGTPPGSVSLPRPSPSSSCR